MIQSNYAYYSFPPPTRTCSLPDTLNEGRFNNSGRTGRLAVMAIPHLGRWSRYGLIAPIWEGRAAELNVQRIDLRDWLCTVVIENRRAIKADS